MYYHIQISLNSTFTDIVVNTTVENITEYNVSKDLNAYTLYWWRVKGVNPITGTESEWSVPCAFRVKAADVVINHEIDKYSSDEIKSNPYLKNSYIIYSTYAHTFLNSDQSECIIPDAIIGVGLCSTSGTGQISYCPGVCVPEITGLELIFILSEDGLAIMTEDSSGLLIESQVI